MIWRSLIAAILTAVISFIGLNARAQVGQIPGWPPVQPAASGASYQGPGDVVSGALIWYGVRCYAEAYSGNVMDVTDAATGSTTGTRLQCASGVVSALVSASACTFVTGNACSSLATTCAVSCNVVTKYDQSGTNTCTGAIPCNVTQATNADRPTLNTNCIGGKYCLVFTSAQFLADSVGPASTISPPYTITAVCERTPTSNSTQDCISWGSAGRAQLGYGTTNNGFVYAGSSVNVSGVTDAVWHSINAYVPTTGFGNFYADGTLTGSLTVGASTIASTHVPYISGANKLVGNFTEGGLWNFQFTTGQYQSMCENEQAFYGSGNFGGVC